MIPAFNETNITWTLFIRISLNNTKFMLKSCILIFSNIKIAIGHGGRDFTNLILTKVNL